jgi:hypothetical protein
MWGSYTISLRRLIGRWNVENNYYLVQRGAFERSRTKTTSTITSTQAIPTVILHLFQKILRGPITLVFGYQDGNYTEVRGRLKGGSVQMFANGLLDDVASDFREIAFLP